ncbi:CapA family protein [Flavobacterium gawalongense]|uniref:CapA family protein n=1 Tax=Flavobacterium gawalongense TaxID=2594432 RepID=A0A553BDY7_9FLAO|nr:CapA family protein [Flavobacterium gawalongense]TRW98923.1 CapA family protein [Flavobacterium gawalongense]TRX03492.1 CapA family protein [Flavobacterium gawalongense]TRX06455.1 CapA family protein [Flavobacterium gawalongense]TRX07280.1 CapA family protein [Flavobacterium gawalongense]TRX25016.1 CapA family protein [Flavobacterium gawalongense]
MSDNTITIGLTGDVMIGRGVNATISNNGYAYPWGNVLPVLKNTDINIINLEAALTNSTKKIFKTFNFKATPDRIKTLTVANITVANIANNHILDFSEEGLIETIQTLNAAGILHAGAGMNENEAEKPVILTTKNNTLGVLGFTDNEPRWKAGISACGVNYIDISNENDCNKALTAIAKLRKETDIVIVSIHWGPNMNEEPERHFVDFAHAMIDHGAAIIHGHSAHNFQGIEVYNHKLILYDTGDFVDDYVVDPYLKNDHSFFFKVEVSKQRIEKVVLIPVLISKYQVNLAIGEDYKWCIQRMQQLSAKFGTKLSDKGEVLLF